jgi:hypothetical protein
MGGAKKNNNRGAIGLRPEGQHGNRPHSREKEGRWNDSNAAVVLKTVVVPNSVVGLKKEAVVEPVVDEILSPAPPSPSAGQPSKMFICHASISIDFIPRVAVIASY